MATEDKSSRSSDQKELNRLPNDQMEEISKQLRRRGYKVIVEYDDTGQPSKISGEIPPRKTWWDWLNLTGILLVPLILVIATILLAIGQAIQQAHLADLEHQQNQQITLDQQRAAILQTYIDNIQDLLLNHNLLGVSPKPKNDADKAAIQEVQELARSRTLTALQGLDPERKGRLLIFLHNAKLIGFADNNGKTYAPIIDLSGADLIFTDLTHISLTGADLSRANLNFADLSRANLNFADLTDVTLTSAFLYGANLTDANLTGANLTDDTLTGASLIGTNLSYANLTNATLTGANLTGASLIGANLQNVTFTSANLQNAILTSADLSGANLSGAIVTLKQLEKAKSLKGAIMPDGSKHP